MSDAEDLSGAYDEHARAEAADEHVRAEAAEEQGPVAPLKANGRAKREKRKARNRGEPTDPQQPELAVPPPPADARAPSEMAPRERRRGKRKEAANGALKEQVPPPPREPPPASGEEVPELPPMLEAEDEGPVGGIETEDPDRFACFKTLELNERAQFRCKICRPAAMFYFKDIETAGWHIKGGKHVDALIIVCRQGTVWRCTVRSVMSLT